MAPQSASDPGLPSLPHNLEAERSVLGAILIDNSGYEVAASRLHSGMFFREAHRRIFDGLSSLWKQGQPLDLVTLKLALERNGDLEKVGGPAYIASLVDGVPRSTNVGYYADTVAEDSRLRQIIFDANDSIKRAYDREASTEIVHSLRSDLEALQVGPAESAAARQSHLVAQETDRERARREAKRVMATERFGRTSPPPVKSLRALLAEPDPPCEWLIDRLFPADNLVMLVAMGKSGKTTLRNNLIRSLVDGVDFLGYRTFKTGPVFVFDMEMSERQTKKWLRDHHVRNDHLVSVVSLKGYTDTFDLMNEASFAYWAREVAATGAETVILDTLNPALQASGLNEREDGGSYVRLFTRFLAACGASNGIINHHTGWTGDRPRGDSGLLDAPDVLWVMSRDKDEKGNVKDMGGVRSFFAVGRDVDFPKTDLNFDGITRTLTLAVMSTADSRADRNLAAVCRVVQKATQHPLGVRSIESLVKLEGV